MHTRESSMSPITETVTVPRLADKVTEAVAGTTFDGILCLHDEAVELGALIAQKLGLSFPSPEVAHRTVNKSAMRARLDVPASDPWLTVSLSTAGSSGRVWPRRRRSC